MRPNVNILGEAIVGDDEARARLDAVLERLRRPDVDYVSVKISAICAGISTLAFEYTVDRIADRLELLYGAAAACDPPVFVNLDMEEYRDLELTVAAFRRVLDETPFERLDAGIVLQAYLPDVYCGRARPGRMGRRSTSSWRRTDQGAPRQGSQPGDGDGRGRVARVGAGAVRFQGRRRRQLQGGARRPRRPVVRRRRRHRRGEPQPLRRGVGTRRPRSRCSPQVDGTGSASRCSRAWRRRSPRPCAPSPATSCSMHPSCNAATSRSALAYLVRRLDENTAPANFLSQLFDLAADPARFERQADTVSRRGRASTPARPSSTPATARPTLPMPSRTDGPFVNAPDTDWTRPANRAWIAERAAGRAGASAATGDHRRRCRSGGQDRPGRPGAMVGSGRRRALPAPPLRRRFVRA